MQGDGWGFDAEFFGGPCDGLKDEVISVTESPPIIWWLELGADGSVEEDKLGMKILNVFLKRTPEQGTKVAVYQLCANHSSSNDEDIVPYKYKETLLFEDYNEKYEEQP